MGPATGLKQKLISSDKTLQAKVLEGEPAASAAYWRASGCIAVLEKFSETE